MEILLKSFEKPMTLGECVKNGLVKSGRVFFETPKSMPIVVGDCTEYMQITTNDGGIGWSYSDPQKVEYYIDIQDFIGNKDNNLVSKSIFASKMSSHIEEFIKNTKIVLNECFNEESFVVKNSNDYILDMKLEIMSYIEAMLADCQDEKEE